MRTFTDASFGWLFGRLWQLSGDDVTHFNLTNDGVLSWNNPPTAGQLSADLDNVFEVIATVNDDEGLQDLIYLSITLV